MSLIVVDASVAAKWCLPAKGETLTDEAFRLLRTYVKGEIQFVVPDLFWAELGNLLWKAVRQGRCAKTEADTALTSLKEHNLPTVPSLSVLDLAFGIATTFEPHLTGPFMTAYTWPLRFIRKPSSSQPTRDLPAP